MNGNSKIGRIAVACQLPFLSFMMLLLLFIMPSFTHIDAFSINDILLSYYPHYVKKPIYNHNNFTSVPEFSLREK